MKRRHITPLPLITNRASSQFLLFFIFLCACCVPRSDAFAQTAPQDAGSNELIRYGMLDSLAAHTPRSVSSAERNLTNHLTAQTRNDAEKAYVIFSWIAHNINYDDNAFNSGNYPDMSAGNVLKRKRGVCEGYSNLYQSMCEMAGLECEKLSGFAKGYGYRPGKKFGSPNHSWNAVKFNDQWHLVDCTWAAGFGENVNGKLRSKVLFDRIWFNVAPSIFIASHLPKDAQWQLLSQDVSQSEYEAWLGLDIHLLTMFDESVDIKQLLSGDAPQGKVVLFSLEKTDISIIEMPVAFILKAGEDYRFEFISKDSEEMKLYWGDKYASFNHEGDRFWIETKARKGQLNITFESKSGTMISLLQYEVK